MKFLSIAIVAASAAYASEDVTISDFTYRGGSGTGEIAFDLSADGVSCSAENFTVPGEGYGCSSPQWSFDVVKDRGSELRLYHELDGSRFAGDFNIRMNGPLPTVLFQVGTSTSTLEPFEDVE